MQKIFKNYDGGQIQNILKCTFAELSIASFRIIRREFACRFICEGFIIIHATLFFLLLAGGLYPVEYNGMSYFKQAYGLEESDPSQAAELYRTAISKGLDRKIYNAARWRLYYLYKELDQFEDAILLLNTFGESKQIEGVRKSLISQMQYYYGISEEAAENFSSGLLISRQRPDEAFQYFEKSLAGLRNNYKLRNEIIGILLRNGRDGDASRISGVVSDTPADEMIARADLFVGKKSWDEAKAILYSISLESYGLSDEQKYKILYLLGKIERGKNNEPSAVVYFRQASRYEKKADGLYSAALTAYSLYKQGNVKSAYGMMKDYPLSEDFNIELLQLILLIEMRHDSRALEKLKTKEEALRKDGGFLSEKALKILDKTKR